MSALDEVISTVLRAREDGPDALAAVALSFGSAMELGTLGNTALKARLAETRAALEAAEATVATLRTERDAARDETKAARQRMEEVREQCDRARDDAEMCARQRDEARARASMLAQDLARVEAERDEAREALAAKDSAPDLDYPARAEVWRLRESVDALRSRAERAEAERDESMAAHDYTRAQWADACRVRDAAREALATAGKVTAQAVREREAFSLRLSAAERERDEARAERDASDERWATVCRECDVALAERDAVQALHAELVAIRADFRHQRDITEDALRERDDARAALDLARESAREAREEIAQSLALVDEARAALDAALARSTYEARTVAPTRTEQDRHKATRGRWLVTWQERHAPALRSDVVVGVWPPRTYPVGAVYLPLDASGLPCAWPVVT